MHTDRQNIISKEVYMLLTMYKTLAFHAKPHSIELSHIASKVYIIILRWLKVTTKIKKFN